MANESEVEVTSTETGNEATEETVETSTESTETQDAAPEKVAETPEAKLARLERMSGQLRKKLGLDKPEAKKQEKSEDIGYAEKAYLVASGIKGGDEIGLVKEIMANTGKSLDDVLESKYFQAELKEMRELRASKDALPNGSKRSAQSARDTVEYWVAKGELPKDNPELARKVVNAKIKSQTSGNPFTKNPIVQ